MKYFDDGDAIGANVMKRHQKKNTQTKGIVVVLNTLLLYWWPYFLTEFRHPHPFISLLPFISICMLTPIHFDKQLTGLPNSNTTSPRPVFACEHQRKKNYMKKKIGNGGHCTIFQQQVSFSSSQILLRAFKPFFFFFFSQRERNNVCWGVAIERSS